jgi:quercetin dioxygenase-like cupin family protein
MNIKNVQTTAREHLEQAGTSGGGRSSATLFGGSDNTMRQTVIAFRAGQELAEHENPGEATVLVLLGRVRLDSGTESWEGSEGDLLVVPDARHSLLALDDAAVLLTVAMQEFRNAFRRDSPKA